MARVLVGMSGGVDSSVAVALLLEQGHEVVGATLRLGIAEIHGRPCCGEDGVAEARRVAGLLGVQHTVVDVAEAFEREVVTPFVEEYATGRTPNPCVVCNERVKFAALLARADALGCDFVATGHYARVVTTPAGSRLVARAADRGKDQSYFLYRLSDDALARTLFPLGGMRKPEVRARAGALGLPVAERAESQEVCFADDHVALVAARRPDAVRPGPIETRAGERVGSHAGIARYTVGQRKGLGIGGPGGPWRVIALDAARNVVVVGSPESLLARRFVLRDAVWRASDATARCSAVLRYRARPLPCEARSEGGAVMVTLDEPHEATAPGQSVVLYEDDAVLGGGVLERWEP
ncbi:MAG: tRNA 2-thiouridine(34) synthase MnmA [Anaerosomatales bacterium]|nr:tRNA 2-thiouridine(34) synthase MnmA [Anaerosomatales bacterium]